MQFNKIEEIKVGGNKKGIVESDGNVFAIVSADYSQSYTQSPSKFSLSLVGVDSTSEMKEYLGIAKDGSTKSMGKQEMPFALSNMETIAITAPSAGEAGEIFDDAIFTFSGFLVSFSESISAGERIYQIEYIDRSVILDKIFVGLSNRHKRVDNPVGGKVTATALCGPNSDMSSETFYFGTPTGRKITKGPASTNLGPKLQTARIWDEHHKKSYIPYFSFNKKEYYAGGKIIVGDEQFSENFCSIHPVDYNLKDLKDGMASAGISTENVGVDLPFQKKGLRREYTGTLRNVLNSWCAEYGLFYLWEDGTSKRAATVKFYDMRAGVGNIAGLKNRMLKLGVENLQFSQTCENSKFTNLVTRFIKPPSINEKTINFSRRVPCAPITLGDISQGSAVNKIVRPAVNNSFLVSCALAKANEDLRTLWYIADSFGTRDDMAFRWEALGIYIVKTEGHDGKLAFSDNSSGDILKGGFIEEYGEIERSFHIDSLAGIGVNNMNVYLVYKSDDMEKRFVDWEKDIANNFIGKYWKTQWVTRQKDTDSCAAIYGRRSRIADSNPTFVDSNDTVIPDISIDPYGGAINSNAAYRSGSFRMNRTVKRDAAPWGTSLVINKDSDTKDYVPKFVPVTLEHYDVMVDDGIIKSEVDMDFSMGGAQFQLGFLFVRRDTRKWVEIENTHSVPNPLETPDSQINGPQNQADVDKCKPSCAVDIAEYICGGTAQNGSNLQPAVHSIKSVGVSVKGKLGVRGTIYCPVGARATSTTRFNRIETINYTNFLSRRGLKFFRENWSDYDQDDDIGPLQSAHVDVVEEDMTNGVLFTSDTGGENTLINGSSYVVRDGIADYMGTIGNDTEKALTEYHTAIQSSIPSGSSGRNQSLSATIPSNRFSELSSDFSISQGLSALSFSFGSSGSTTKVTFRSLPKQFVNKENVIPMIKILTSHFRN